MREEYDEKPDVFGNVLGLVCVVLALVTAVRIAVQFLWGI